MVTKLQGYKVSKLLGLIIQKFFNFLTRNSKFSVTTIVVCTKLSNFQITKIKLLEIKNFFNSKLKIRIVIIERAFKSKFQYYQKKFSVNIIRIRYYHFKQILAFEKFVNFPITKIKNLEIKNFFNTKLKIRIISIERAFKSKLRSYQKKFSVNVIRTRCYYFKQILAYCRLEPSVSQLE